MSDPQRIKIVPPGAAMEKPADQGSLWTLYEAAEFLGVSYQHLTALVRRGEGPKCYDLGSRAHRMRPSDVQAWLETRQMPRKEGAL